MIIYGNEEIVNTPYSKLTVFSHAEVWHGHTFFELAIVLEGTCKSIINNAQYTTLRKGDFIFIRPGDKHVLFDFSYNYKHRDLYVSQEKMELLCSVYGKDFYSELMDESATLEYKIDINELTSIENRANIFNQTNYNLEDDKYLDRLHTSLIQSLLGSIVYSKTPINELIPNWLRKLFLHLSSYHYISHTVEEIVATTGYSHSYVCHMFKTTYGTTIQDCLNKSKVILSTTLLGENKIIDIALSLGWCNPKNYTIAFKKVYGMTPQRYIALKKNTDKAMQNGLVYPTPPKQRLSSMPIKDAAN